MVEKQFKISSVYSELNDVAEEAAWKHIIYSPKYLKALNSTFNMELPGLDQHVDQLIYGTYSGSNDVYKRPLTKMIQDTNQQLKEL